ncbi:multivesicular body subunit 12A-like [Athene cunicularia]|uniref:multivesicular body subunit 12A-like n=1 Tax=Athene cunicularia TaxID=194338 RepID=UPI000EF6FE4E|nr:multivesicular body subunit 12A-like [Athene cunicularia]
MSLFSAQKLEHILKQTEGFSPEAFKANARLLSEDLERYLQKLKRDGTLKSCIEDPNGVLLDTALEDSVAQVKEYSASYTRASEFPEPRPGVSRKKRVYVKLVPPEAAGTALLALQLSHKSRALPQHLRIGEIGNFALWCKKGPVLHSRPQPVPSPRTISAGLKQLSLQAPDSDPRSPSARSSVRHEALYDTANIYGLSAMDGVPFTLHPKFESKLSSGSNAVLADLNVKSLADIEEEYNYAFVVERTAAARLPPGVC